MNPKDERMYICVEGVEDLVRETCLGFGENDPEFIQQELQHFYKYFEDRWSNTIDHETEESYDAFHISENEYMEWVKDVRLHVTERTLVEMMKEDLVDISLDANGEFLFSLSEKGKKGVEERNKFREDMD
jgi:hypothetical protein